MSVRRLGCVASAGNLLWRAPSDSLHNLTFLRSAAQKMSAGGNVAQAQVVIDNLGLGIV